MTNRHFCGSLSKLPSLENNHLPILQTEGGIAIKKVLIITCGGTICMTPRKGVLKPLLNADQLISRVPFLKKVCDLKLENFLKLDSTNMAPSHWTEIANKILTRQEEADAIIVSHGTDTMAFTASAISIAMGAHLKIPVAITGSQLSLAEFGTDARFNLENSMKVVLEAIELGVKEVMIVFGDKVFRGNRAVKTNEARFPAFDSPAFPPLAEIDATGVHFSVRYLDSISYGSRFSIQPLHSPQFDDRLLTLDLTPGFRPELVLHSIMHKDCRAMLLRSLGAGNVPNEGPYNLLPVIEAAIQAGKPVFVSTKFVGGTTRMELYEPGKAALDAGAIPTGDMTSECAQAKIMWLLKWVAEDPFWMHNLAAQMLTSYAGEVTGNSFTANSITQGCK